MSERKFHACSTREVSPGRQKIVQVANMPVGIFQVGEDYYALLNICPHRGGQLCEGPQCGTTLPTDDYEYRYGHAHGLVRCAWHGWEFDIATGEALADPDVRAKTFGVSVEEGEIFVHL